MSFQAEGRDGLSCDLVRELSTALEDFRHFSSDMHELFMMHTQDPLQLLSAGNSGNRESCIFFL